MNMLRNFCEKCGSKFPATTLSYRYSIVKIACLNDAFSEIFELEASPIEGQLLPQKDKRRRKRKGEKKNKQKKQRAYFLVKKLHILISVHAEQKCSELRASGKKGKLPCCKMSF